MPSPFPGMNPYLERAGVWEMFHTQFLSTLQQVLTPQIRPRYRAKLETRVTVHEPEGVRRSLGEPDVGISITSDPAPATTPAAGTAILTPTMYVTEPSWLEIEKTRYLEIRDRQSQDVVTVIELLSPSNKYAGPDRESYLTKRREYFRSRAHVVEIDLLRGGPRMPFRGTVRCDYCALVGRAEERPRVGVWSWWLQEPIPRIPIPLREPDPDILLDIKAILDQVYDAGGYADEIYTGLPEPHLSLEDAAWAAAFVPPGTPTL